MAKGQPSIHPWWLRFIHWANAAAVVVLILSGWRIYNATGFMGFKFHNDLTLGGWLGGAIQWHFAAMWVLFASVALYLVMSFATRRWSRQYFPLTLKNLVDDVKQFVRGKLGHKDISVYNAIQKAAYLFAMIDLIVLIISGFVLWKPVQLSWLGVLVGGYEGARRVHFFAMAGICVFIVVHVVMAVLVPKTIKAMVWGR